MKLLISMEHPEMQNAIKRSDALPEYRGDVVQYIIDAVAEKNKRETVEKAIKGREQES